MTGIGGCRSSNSIAADTLITEGQGKVISIHALATTNGDAAILKLHDCLTQGTCSDANLIAMIAIKGTTQSIPVSSEQDIHGVIFRTGLYADVTVVNGSTSTFLVNFN